MEHATAISMDTPTPTSTLPTPPTSAPLHTTAHTSIPPTTTAHTTALTTPTPTQITSPISKPDVLSTRVYAHDRDQDQGRDQEPPSPPHSLETISRTLGTQPLSLSSSRTTRGQAATTKAVTDASSREITPQEQLEKATPLHASTPTQTTSASLGASVAGRVPEAVSDGPGLAHTFTAATAPAATAASAPTTAVPTSAPTPTPTSASPPTSSAAPLSTTVPTTSTTAPTTTSAPTPITETAESTLPPTPTSFTTPHISSPPVVALVKTPLPSPPMSPVRPTRVEAVNEERGEQEREQERREGGDESGHEEGEREESDGFDFGQYARFEDESLESHSHQEEQLQPQSHSQLPQQQPQLQLDQQEEQEQSLTHEHEHEHEDQRMDERTRIEHWLAQQCRMSMLFGSAEAEAVEQVYLSYGPHPTTPITPTITPAPGAGGFTLRDEEGGVQDIWAGRGDVDSDEGAGVDGRKQWVVPMPMPGEEEGIRADSPLLGFGEGVVGVGRDKPLPPPPRVSSTPTPPPLPAKDPRRMESALGTQVEFLECPSASPSESPSPVGQTVGLPSLSASLTSTPSSGFTVPSALVAAAGVGGVNNVSGVGQRPQQQQTRHRTSGYHLQQQFSQQSQQQQQQPSVGRQSPSRQYGHSPSASFSSATQVLLPIGAVASVGVGAATSSTYGYSSTHTYSTPAATHAYTPTSTNVYTPAPAHAHARGAHGGSMSSLSLSLGSGSGIGMGVPTSLSRRPSLLRIPSLPLLGEGEVLDVSSGVQATGEEKVGVLQEESGAEQVDEGLIGIATATAVSSTAGEGDTDVVGDAGDDNGVYGHGRGLGLGLGQEEDGHQNPTMGARRSRFRSQSSSALYHLECSSANNSSTTSNDINSTAGSAASNANSNATGTGTGAEIVTPQAMFHLPTAMQNQVRRSRSSQMLLGYSGSSSASLSVLGGEGSAIGTPRSSAVPSRATTPLGLGMPSPSINAPSSLLNTPSSVSGMLSSMSSSSALLSVVGSHATSTNASPLLLPPSPLPPSAPPTRRSRAGSLSAGAVLGLGLGLGGLGVEGHSADGGRHTHAPSVGSVASSGKGIRDAMYIDSKVVTAKLDALLAGAAAEEQRQVQQDEDEEVDGMMEGVLDRWMGGEQEQSGRWEDPEPAYPRGASGALGFDPDDDAVNALRTPPSSALSASTYTTPTNARKHHAGVSGTWSSSASVAPPNTPSTPYSPKLVPLHSQQSQHSLKSQKQHQHSHPYPYQNPQASSSQVYVGPALPQSPGHSSQGHDAHVYGQSLDQQQQQLLLHSRNASSASSSNNALAVRSRIHSRATSKESSPAPGSPRAVARLERSPSATHVLVARPHARSVSSARAAAASGAMSIPVPVQPVSAEATGNTRPARPPPAPPLDLDLAAATVRSVVEEEGVGALRLRDIGMQMQMGLLENSEESYGVRGEEGVVEGDGVLDEVVGVEAEEEQEQEISDDEMDRLQFLRGLRLEDRMEEFRGVDFPSGMDDGFKGGVIDGGAGVYPEEDLDEPVVPHSLQERPAMMRSMSRWSLGSSNADERAENTAAVAKKEKKRKSFVTAFGVSGGDDSKHTTSASSTSPTPAPAASKEKKRGRLASFISRLSGVGSGGTVSSPTTPGGSPGKLPPIPNSPATPGFMSTYASDPFASNMALSMAADEPPAVPPIPAGLLPSPMIVDPILRRMKSQESVGGIEVAGSVYGVWDPQPSSHAPRQKSVSSSNSAQSIRNQTHPPITTIRPTLAKAYSEDAISAMGRKAPHVAWEKDVGGGGGMTERGEKTAVTTGDNAGLTMRARSNTTGDIFLLSGAKRPALHKSASASVLGPNGQQMDGQRKTPTAIHTRIQYRGTAVAVDDSMPPTPSSITSTDIEEEDEEEEEEDYGVEVHQRGRIRREQEHEERWAKLRANVDSEVRLRQQQPLPTIPMSPPLPSSSTTTEIESAFKAPPLPSSPPAQTSQIMDQRQRLKSMPSLVSVHPSPPASASTTNFGLLLPLSSKSSKGSGFRGLVGRMGFGSSSANNTKNNSPVSSHPGTPLTSAPPQSIHSTGTDPSVDGVSHHASHFSGGKSSVSHSPTTSFSQSGSHNDASLHASGAVMGRRPPKRKLVISGVSPGNAKGFQAVKAWCESFGEVKDMSRSPNGDVYVDYKSAAVAETVCRVQAKVFIKGAGSVSLSWYTKKRP